MFYTYILLGSSWKYYVWYTQDLERRLAEHRKLNNTKFTGKIWDISLIWYFEFSEKWEAINFEKQIKRSGHISRYITHIDFIKNMRH